jgi:hypothetical protein
MFVLIVSQAAFSPGARGDIEHTVLLLHLRTLKETREYQGWQEGIDNLTSERRATSTPMSQIYAAAAVAAFQD